MGDRPLEALEAALDQAVTVQLKDGTGYHGVLAGFDQHLNLVLEDPGLGAEGRPGDGVEPVEGTIVIRGDNVVSITP